ncbi:hypothetical protein C3K47_13085 [Solitalea longa]|uniref:Uncharacterized protein n=2 Tax=Solitalea longa TaxID=2079460 RepID=A0A2S5A0R3_9SPHI|nr:hypothetical protein C3K47_13085 [Solitalea longa]
MKKIVAIIMCLFFLLNTIGVGVYTHYCGTTMQDTSIAVKPECCCSKGDDDKDSSVPEDDCCRNDVKIVKIEDSYLSLAHAETVKLFPVQLFLVAFHFTLDAQLAPETLVSFNLKSPPLRSCSIRHLTQVFLI